MRAAFASRAQRLRSTSISAVPPPLHSPDYSNAYAAIAASILYRSPLPSESGLPVFILNAAAFPDSFEVDYDSLLPYVLARLPGEEELLAGEEYEIIFFAGGQPESATCEKKSGPGVGWYIQAYHVLSRAIRKRLQRLYVVHERSWVRVLIEVFGTIVSPKFRKKIVHLSSLSSLALHIPIEKLLIPPSIYLHDRRVSPDIHSPYVSGRRAFTANDPLPRNLYGQRRLPRVLRETTSFICKGDNIKTEGLFRIPAHNVLSGVLKEAYDRGQQFIVWKEGSTTYTQPDMDRGILNEIHQADAYGVHLAAGLIKMWYRELKTPIFQESCYDEVRYKFASPDYEVELNDMAELLSPISTTSCLSPIARLIMTSHLIPMLSLVTQYQSANKMSPENLAICFSPALVCGSDQLADAKMTSVLRRVLVAAIEYWPNGLSDACQTSPESFASAIQPPSARLEYEDPLIEGDHSASEVFNGEPHRILLHDGDSEEGPPLPPRPSSFSKKAFPKRSDSLASSVKRKPAPFGSAPPRSSSLITNAALDTPGPPVSNASPVESFTTGVRAALPSQQTTGAVRPWMTAPTPVVPSQTDLLKELRNSLTTEIVVRRKPVSSSASPISPSSPVDREKDKVIVTQKRSVSARVPPVTKEEDAFARPTWTASSRQVPVPGIVKSRTAPPASAQTSLTAPSWAAKPRAPSPGLLKRMASIESMHSAAQQDALRVEPLANKIGLRKASVDDLKRLYEERAQTTAKLADVKRRESNAT